MGLSDRDYMQQGPRPDDDLPPPKPRWGIIIVAVLVIVGFLFSLF